jgi:GGDEF domain-containing protein
MERRVTEDIVDLAGTSRDAARRNHVLAFQVGDRMLPEFAELLKDVVLSGSLVGRLGGYEFAADDSSADKADALCLAGEGLQWVESDWSRRPASARTAEADGRELTFTTLC